MGTVLNSSVVTLAELAKRMDPDGKIGDIVEMLTQVNPILEDMIYKEGNLITGERTTIRTGLPTAYWRIINQGVPSSKSRTAQVDESCGMMEALSELDEELAELDGNVNALRLSEAQAFVEAMSQEMASTLFYGDSSISPNEFTGLSPRYSDLSAANAQNILDGGGTGSDNSSIWLVQYAPDGVLGIYPKGTTAGLQHFDKGKQMITTSDDGGLGQSRLFAYVDQWKWKCGLVVKNWQSAVRICNLDISALVAESSAANLIKLMLKATHRIPNLQKGKVVFYMNRTCFQGLDIQRLANVTSGGGLNYENVDGKVVYSFRGIPIKVTDALLETESRVT